MGDLARRGRQQPRATAPLPRRVPAPGDHDRHGADRAHEVARIHDRPVAQHGDRRDAPARPGEDEQDVAGEELGAADHHQDEAEGEGDAARTRVTP